MKWFYNMKIASKLILGFILVAAIACAIGGIGWSQIKVIDASDTILYEKNAKPLGEIGLISTDFQRIRVNLRDIIMDEGTPQRQKYVDTVKLLDSDIDKNMSSFEAGIASEEVRQKFNTLKADIAEWKPVQDRIIALGVANQDDQALALLRGDGKKIADNVMANIDWMVDKKTIQAKERSEENTATANKAINMMIAFIIGGILLALALGLFISRVISNPIKNLADIAEKLAVGDVDVKVEATTKDEVGDLMGAFGEMIAGIKAKAEAAQRIAKGDVNFEVNAMSEKDVLAISMKQVVEALRGLIAESDMLTKAAVAGKLDTRGSADKFAGGYKDIVEGVNSTLDSVIGPLNVAAEYVDRISKGDIPPKITDTYNGDFNEIKNNLNQCIDAINLLVADANVLSVAAVQGKLDTRAEANKHHGDFRRIVQGVNDTLDAIIGPLNVAAEYVERIAKGDIPPEITDTYNGDFNEIKNNLNTCIGAIGTLVEEMGNIIDASKEGRLDARADDNKANGVYRKLLRGINETVDAFVGPINVTAEYVDRISKGQIPPKITDDYNGDFNEIKNNLNNCIDVMNGLLQETDLLIKATQEGRLDTRGKADKFAGGWGQLVGGVNNLIDAFVGPINVTAEYVDRISKGDIPPKITDEYYGDFNEIKNNLNSCIEVMSGLLQETDLLIKATQEGRLDTRGKADIYAGGWGELVGGVNNLIDAFVGPINVTAEYVDRISKGDIPPKITDTYYGDFNEIK
ncbi:MAG: MCP four helix bundle domain-containing protein, partial [Acidobacteriota bacterium]